MNNRPPTTVNYIKCKGWEGMEISQNNEIILNWRQQVAQQSLARGGYRKYQCSWRDYFSWQVNKNTTGQYEGCV